MFTVGVLAFVSHINIIGLIAVLIIAAILGDGVNYATGYFFGKKMVTSKWIKKDHLTKSQAYFQRHGAISIMLARFIPFMRTFMPFIAGLSHMNTRKYITYNIIGGTIWVVFFVGLGYFFPNIPFIKDWFGL